VLNLLKAEKKFNGFFFVNYVHAFKSNMFIFIIREIFILYKYFQKYAQKKNLFKKFYDHQPIMNNFKYFDFTHVSKK